MALALVQWAVLFSLLPLAQNALTGSASLALFYVAAVGSALALTALALLAWLSPENRFLLTGCRLLQTLRQHPLSLAPSVLVVAAGVILYLRGDVYTVVSVQLGLLALLLYAVKPAAWDAWDGKVLVVASALVILLGLGLRLWLLLVDWVWTDEGFHLSAAVGMLQGGGIAPAIMHFPDDILIGPWRGFAFGVYGLWARVFGVGLMQARALAYLFGVLALPFIYGASRLWYGRRTAWVTTSIATLSILFMRSTNGRTDSLPMAAISVVMFAHVYACHRRKPLLHALVGLLAALALETHFANLLFFVPWGGVYLVDYLVQARREGRLLRAAPLWYFLAGAIPGLLIYAYLHVLSLPYPSAMLGAADSFVGSRSVVGWRLQTALTRFQVYWGASPAENLLIGAALVAALVRRTEADRHWLLLFAFAQFGYVALGPYANLSHVIYGLPVFVGAVGALVTYGFRREEQTGTLWERVVYVAIVLVLATFTVATIRQHSKDRLALDARRRPIVEYIRRNVPADEAIIGPSIFYAYLVEYHPYTYMIRGYPAGLRGPALAGVEPEAYWRDVLLDTWPVARIDPSTPFDKIEVYDSYMAARQAQEVLPDLWVVAGDALVTDAPYASAYREATLQMVAHVGLPSSVAPGAALPLDTIWVARGEVGDDYVATLSLTGPDGASVAQADQELLSGAAGSPTSGWSADQFHDVALALDVPPDLPGGTYTLRLDLHAPSAETSACAPGCRFAVGEIRVSTP